MSEDIEIKRLRWHSRRGMLELDVLLVPFVDEAFAGLSPEDKAGYEYLLEQEDTDLFAWFLERQVPEDERLAHMVTLVLEHARSRK
ncbi:MAG: succinate dehydrogenase assembly factor 2 [Oceanobacter sp.]